jgi:sterol desaturase/sphingolipid hydroxylase (fatty acid hydroxylase superfamily)
MLFLTVVMISLFVVERLTPGKVQPEVRGWWWRAIFLNAIVIPVFTLTHELQPWLVEHRLGDALSGLPPFLAGIIGFVVFQFFHYWWHRARHESDFLWRWVHQVHHSPRRLEVLTAGYAHPLDSISYVIMMPLVTVMLLGLSLEGAQWAAVIDSTYTYFIHSNLRSPYWIGYFIQRPEMHRIHHQYGVHRYNYALPIWDMMFGTHRNPREEGAIQCGFDADKEARLGDMLIGRDVHLTAPARDS